MKNTSFLPIIEIAARWYVSAMISLYAIGKLTNGQFYRKGHLPPDIAHQPLDQVGAFDLAWTFFGYSNNYILFIGCTQLIGALLLLSSRTKLIGVAVLLPILLNIIVVDAEFGVGDAIVSAIFYFSLLLLIIVLNRKKVWAILQLLTTGAPVLNESTTNRLFRWALVFSILVAVFFLETICLKVVGFSRF